MSLISGLRTYVMNYPGLVSGAPLLIDALGSKPTQYSIIPAPGPRIVAHYVDGGAECAFPFTIQSTESTADDLQRIENSGMYEALAAWFDTQTEAGSLPTLGAKQTATAVEALSWGFIYEQGNSGTGIYQIQCVLRYEQGV